MALELAAPETLFQAVSDSTRLRLLRLLENEELNVQEMVRILDMSQPRVSKHLAVLKEAGWIRQRKEGTWSWYRSVDQAEFAESFAAGSEIHSRTGEALFAGVLAAAHQNTHVRQDDANLAVVLVERETRARDFFAGIAGRWDEIRRSYEHPDIQLGAVSALVTTPLTVIDIGTGTGALLPLLASVAQRVVAVDNSEAMLARARALCEHAHLEGVTFQRAGIQALPFAAGSFHAAYCSMVLHHVARPVAAVREMARVVKPGGKVVVIAFTRHNMTWMREELAHHWLGFDQDDVQQIYEEAGLTLQQFLVRGRTPGVEEMSTQQKTERKSHRTEEVWKWPDVFLAVGTKS